MYNNEAKPDTHHKRVEMEATKETRGVSQRHWDASSSVSHTAALNEEMVVGV